MPSWITDALSIYLSLIKNSNATLTSLFLHVKIPVNQLLQLEVEKPYRSLSSIASIKSSWKSLHKMTTDALLKNRPLNLI
jgi:hypothetical protein